MDDQDDADLGKIDMDVLNQRLGQQAGTDGEEENDPFEGSFSGSDTSTVQEQVVSDGEPKPVSAVNNDMKMDLSDDEDTVNELKVDENVLSTFAKRVQAASAQTRDAENDELSAADPFESLTDSDASVLHQLKKGEFDISSAIHSQAERGEFDISSLIEQFRAAQRAHEEVFGNVLSLPRVQVLLAPQMKVQIPKPVQAEFAKQGGSPIVSMPKTDVLESYKNMLSTCVEQHLSSITAANRRRSVGSKRRLFSRADDRDLTDSETFIHSFLNAILSSYLDLIVKTERDDARQWIEDRMKSVEQCLAEMIVQFQTEINLDRASRIDNSSNLEGVIIGRLNRLEERLFEIESLDTVRLKDKHRRQFSSDQAGTKLRQPQEDKPNVYVYPRKQGCNCSRWLMILLQLCTVLLLFEVLHFSIIPSSRLRQSFPS